MKLTLDESEGDPLIEETSTCSVHMQGFPQHKFSEQRVPICLIGRRVRLVLPFLQLQRFVGRRVPSCRICAYAAKLRAALNHGL